MLFSKYFKLNKHQRELDFVDIPIGQDILLFIDPYVIRQNQDRRSLETHNKIIEFFDTVLSYIRKWKTIEAMNMLEHLKECNDTHFWFAKGSKWWRGVGKIQWKLIFDALMWSQAVKTWFLKDIEDCALLIDGISNDKISDITTRIILDKLIEYTQDQCILWDVPMSQVPSGYFRDTTKKTWIDTYVNLPVVKDKKWRKKIILIPKLIAKYKLSLNSNDYYDHHVLNFLQQEYLQAGDSLCRTLKSWKLKEPTKKDLRKKHEFSKEFIWEFSKDHPQIFKDYKTKQKYLLRSGQRGKEIVTNTTWYNLKWKIAELKGIKKGNAYASHYHKFMFGALEFIFSWRVTNPRKEEPIHTWRKRIDIVFTNIETPWSFFADLAKVKRVPSAYIMVECKNYSSDPQNTELDQMSWRFSVNRGMFWIITCRDFINKELFYLRCRDTSLDKRWYIIVLDDSDVIHLLTLKAEDKISEIYNFLDNCYKKIV